MFSVGLSLRGGATAPTRQSTFELALLFMPARSTIKYMKQIIVASILAVLVMFPIVLPAPALAVTASETQKDLLIQLLLEKVKMLQLELQVLIKTKESPVKVEIANQNTDYKKEVKPLVDLLEAKESARLVLMKKLEESQCIKPWRYTSKGVTKFTCKDTQFKFSSTPTSFVLTPEITVAKLAQVYGLETNQIKFIPAVYAGFPYKGDESLLTSPATAIVPPQKEMTLITKQIEALDKEISDLNTRIKSLKTRYGISS